MVEDKSTKHEQDITPKKHTFFVLFRNVTNDWSQPSRQSEFQMNQSVESFSVSNEIKPKKDNLTN